MAMAGFCNASRVLARQAEPGGKDPARAPVRCGKNRVLHWRGAHASPFAASFFTALEAP
jgi:hypothetical protein